MHFDASLRHLGRDASFVVDPTIEGLPYEATVVTYALDECLRADALHALWKDLWFHVMCSLLHLMRLL